METITQSMNQFPWEPVLVLLVSLYGIRRRSREGVGRREFERYKQAQERKYNLLTTRWARLAVRVGVLESTNGGEPT